MFTISGKTLAPAGKIQLGDAKSGPERSRLHAYGRTALVSRDGDHKISVLTVDGNKVEYAKRDINAGLQALPARHQRARRCGGGGQHWYRAGLTPTPQA